MTTHDLSQRPDASWSLDQCLIWIATRDEDLVYKASPRLPETMRLSWMKYQAAVGEGEMVRPQLDFHLVEDVLLTELQSSRLHARHDLDPVPEIWFHEAEYRATVDLMSFQRQDRVPREQWQWPDGCRLDQYAIIGKDPLFDPAEVRRRFPGYTGVHGAATSRGEMTCEKWLQKLMSGSPAEKTASKGELFQQAQNQFSVSERGFERAWARAVSETGAEAWSKPGAPRRKNRRV